MADGDRGTNIEGRANVDHDLIGRDQTNRGNQVSIAIDRLSDVSERETNTIRDLSHQIAALADDVTALTRALIGDPRYETTGLVQRVRELTDNGRQRERWRMISTWLLVVTVVMQAIQWWLLWRVYELYWVIYQAVQR